MQRDVAIAATERDGAVEHGETEPLVRPSSIPSPRLQYSALQSAGEHGQGKEDTEHRQEGRQREAARVMGRERASRKVQD